MRRISVVLGPLALTAIACGATPPPAVVPPVSHPSVLLVTLDTTRADAIGPEAVGVETPAFNALAARGRRFRQAYATVPETLPSHSSLMTGLYPGGHGVHENARYLPASDPVIADQLQRVGYRTSAFVSSFILTRRFGLARGFDLYDDDLGANGVERTARATTDRAIEYLGRVKTLDPAAGASKEAPQFLWVHYFEPHTPYAPPEPFRTRYAAKPYLGEVAAMDEQLGRLVQAFESSMTGPKAIVVVADHGEGLGDHGELQHGHLLYQSTVHVPLLIVGPGTAPAVIDAPVSTRRVYHTILDLAGLDPKGSLRADDGARPDVVLAEAMKPFMEFGWQPQVMAIRGTQKSILSGRVETYDLAADPGETHDLTVGVSLPPAPPPELRDYPVPSADAARAPADLGDDARKRLASLGYVGAGAAPIVRKDAPRPVDMVALFPLIEQASTLFVQERYAQVIPLLDKIIAADRFNLDATLRLATAHSMLGHDARAVEVFTRAAELAPRSPDVRTYLALHYARGREWERAAPMLERIVADMPERLPALEALASIRIRQQRPADAVALLQKAYGLREASPDEWAALGGLAMAAQQTTTAIDAFSRAQRAQGSAFAHDLELGVLYLSARRFDDARAALDRVPPTHPDYPMALFKRAQVSVLLNEPDAPARIDAARRRANATTRALIASEKLFAGR